MHFKVILSLIIEIWNCLKSEVVFFPVFPTLGVQNLFFPGQYLPVNTTVKTGYRPKPSNPVCVHVYVIVVYSRASCQIKPWRRRLKDNKVYSNGLVQERRNSIANALELRLSCITPSCPQWNWQFSDFNVQLLFNLTKENARTPQYWLLCIGVDWPPFHRGTSKAEKCLVGILRHDAHWNYTRRKFAYRLRHTNAWLHVYFP